VKLQKLAKFTDSYGIKGAFCVFYVQIGGIDRQFRIKTAKNAFGSQEYSFVLERVKSNKFAAWNN
jgi:hypothetical protein